MPEEGEQIAVEHQSNAGKWILILLAVAFVGASAYAHYAMHSRIEKLTKDLSASHAQVAELQNRMQTAEASEETIARQVGMTKKELASRAAQLQAAQRAAESRLEEEQKKQITQVSGDIAGVKTDVGGVKTDVAPPRQIWKPPKPNCRRRRRSRRAKRADRHDAIRPGGPQAQGRSQLL